jgi:putative aminopeptidase FrvX
MREILIFLKEMISLPGLSGYESSVSKIIEQAWIPIVDEISYSKLGSLHGLKKGSAAAPRPSILVAVHMDAVGYMVAGIDEGFLHIIEIGGADPRILPGQPVTVHGRKNLPGLIVLTPPHLRDFDNESGVIHVKDLVIDTGLESKQVTKLIRVGDLVSFNQQPFMMGEDLIAGHSLDNRSSVAALTHCLELLTERQVNWDVLAVATVQEEENFAGSYTSTFNLQPDLAIALDVTFASSAGSTTHNTFPLGKGITLGWGPNIHPRLYRDFKDLAEKLEIPHHLEITPTNSGTDAFAMQISRIGVPCMILGIPIRYMHTPVELASLKDIFRAGRLIAEFISSLDLNYLSKLTWDD